MDELGAFADWPDVELVLSDSFDPWYVRLAHKVVRQFEIRRTWNRVERIVDTISKI
jgi:hypothetical protein